MGKEPLHKRLARAQTGHAPGEMLVLSRKESEDIIINNNIAVTIIEMRGNKARIGIKAPKNIPIYRAEIDDNEKRRVRQKANQAGSSTVDINKAGGYLTITREKDQRIEIGDNISIMVVEIRGDKVRLGIEAPKEVPVHRKEVYDAIQRERTAAESG